MKNILSILVVSVFLFGCSKSGDSPNDINDTSGSILGSWDLITITDTETTSYLDPIYGTEEYQYTTGYVVEFPDEDGWSESWTFRYDDTYLRDQISPSGTIYTDTLNYEKIGDTLSVKGGDWTITTLNNSSLSFQRTGSVQWSSNDTTFLSELTEVYSFTKSIN